MTDQIPKNQQNSHQGNKGNQCTGADADDGIAHNVQQIKNTAQHSTGENRLAELLADDAGEEKAVHSAKKRIANSDNKSYDQTDDA